MSDKFYLVEVPEKDIEPARVKFAGSILDYCEKRLGLRRRPRIRWFKQTDELDYRTLKHLSNLAQMAGSQHSGLPHFAAFDEKCSGFFALDCCTDSIFIRADLSGRQIKEAVAHELSHFLLGPKANGEMSEGERERRADEFERELLSRLNQCVLFG